METIGQRIRRRREEKGIARKDLAKAAGLSYTTLSDLELGESHASKALHRIAAELGVSAEWLETGKGSAEPVAPPSQHTGQDADTMRTAARFLEDLFAARGKVFIASERIPLLLEVYAALSAPDAPNLVALTIKYGKRLDGDADEREKQAGSVGADGGSGDRRSARTAKAAGGRKK
jgi:transcriptional regulator with XRE-family HTH domain